MPTYLQGPSVLHLLATKEGRKSLLGKRVQYLREVDIDKSGRGYYFPRTGTIEGYSHRGLELAIDDPQNFIVVRSTIREMVLVEEAPQEESPH